MKNDDHTHGDGKERVIFLWSVPANGHLNPTLCFTNQLLQNLDAMKIKKIIFYCGVSFRDSILNLPNNIGQNRIEFRDYRLEKYTGSENLLKLLMNFDTRPGTLFRAFQCFENAVKLGNKHIFKYLLQDIYKDKPVLILYDQALFFPKLALCLYEKKYQCSKPLHACYVTTFLCAKGVYPYWSELGEMGLLGNNTKLHNKIRNLGITVYDLLKYIFTYYKTLWWEHQFTFIELINNCELPFSRNYLIDDSFNLVFVLPEVQPRLNLFQSSHIKFVGPCVDESVRSKLSNCKFDMQKYATIIENFLEKNTLKKSSDHESFSDNNNNLSFKKNNDLMRSDSNGDNFKNNYKPIIYVSMGTVFNNENKDLFKVLVDACKSFSHDYSIIISTGDEKTYEKYSSSNTERILFVPHTPQVEILKRAHLFITHAGMNSVSEAMQFGVPIICLPLSGDQPFVAWRVADELGIGIRLQPDADLTVEKVKDAISKILSDPIYRERAYDLSLISRRYCGHKIAVEHLASFIKNNEPSANATNANDSIYSSTSSLLNSNQRN